MNEKESGLFVKLNTMWEHGIVKRKYLTIVGDDDNDNLRYPSVNLYEYYKQYKMVRANIVLFRVLLAFFC